MVRNTFYIALCAFFVALTTSFLLSASDFKASVSSTQVKLSEGFTLSLTLKDVSAREAPALSALKKDFLIQSQQQSNNTFILNGKVSSNITWKLSLIPRAEGVVQVPAITIETAEGILSTQPITINVSKDSSSSTDTGLNIITKVSNASPYKNEPFTYTAMITSKSSLYNVQTEKITVDGAIVEILGEPKLEEKIIDGVLLNVIELNYLITPLKTGNLTIPPVAIQGAIPQRRRGQSSFNDDFDSFGFIRGFERLKPFSMMTEEIQLDVLPPVSEISPWIPAKSLTIEEQWPDDVSLRVGEPITRGFLIKAEGVKASQLPHLEDLLNQNPAFKVYADKPEEQEKVNQSSIHSERKEQYTLIPQQSGKTVLPEISISWWDSVKKVKRVSTIPERIVEILPSLTPTTFTPNETPVTLSDQTQHPVVNEQSPIFFYIIISLLSLFLCCALLWAFSLKRKLASLTAASQKTVKATVAKTPNIKKDKKEKLPDLNPT